MRQGLVNLIVPLNVWWSAKTQAFVLCSTHSYLTFIRHSHTYMYTYTCNIYTYMKDDTYIYWRIFRSSYRKLVWVGFEPTITKLRSHSLTNWAIRTWVQLKFKANFVQLLQFDLFFQCSRFISVIAFISRDISHR